ncbi:RNA 2',3'-cyclic phosphodiesterase [Govanella unica]|uniref:RNA 2',3'-cyclic phosphodiesterase n=1 Tax=Govanella unica TaxID=2975056 RepID=A0A9X3Z5Z9_9PROT|nr:RNA 2',3'-cyclic phosphodiesterase [Govania unica]MDA5192660.1 RNA 2',3'-cyclic phosphodiesterase [Govania unica]
MIRLFVAIELPEPIRNYLLRLQTGIRAAYWQRDDQLHLTLSFIGDVDEGTARDIDTALATITMPAFTIALDGAGLFGTMFKPRILWAGIAPRDPVIRLHDKIETAIRRLGLQLDDRKFAPHATLARIRDGRAAAPGVLQFLEAHGGLISASFEVNSFALYSSKLTDQGPQYHVEARYPLAGFADL